MTASTDNSLGMEFLRWISELYLTVRGFAFANSCLEMYKQRSNQQIQKSKALRKKVASKEQGGQGRLLLNTTFIYTKYNFSFQI